MPALKWSFIINIPNNNYMKGLAKSFSSYDAYLYMDDYDDWGSLILFSSIHLNHLTNIDEVYEKAYKLKCLIDGFSYIIHEKKEEYCPIELGTLYDSDNNAITHYNRQLSNFSFDIDFTINKFTQIESYHELKTLITLAKQDKFILNLLYIASQGMGFTNMYRILDEIKTFLKDKGGIKSLNINEKKLNEFTHTANTFDSIGHEARHGTLSHSPPKNPMSIREAQDLISDVIRACLLIHYNIDLPIKPEIKLSIDDISSTDW